MIGFLEGHILHFEADGILLLTGQVGYEILLSPQLVETLRSKETKTEPVRLYIYYHLTERQPKPVLIGFETLEDKQFFQTFITVDAIGPIKAVKAMTRPIHEIALAIEKKEVSFLTGLTGIGKRTAEKIIATLHGKVEKYISAEHVQPADTTENIESAFNDIAGQVTIVLVEQLGHSQTSARRMIKAALERNPAIATPEELFDEIYQEGGAV